MLRPRHHSRERRNKALPLNAKWERRPTAALANSRRNWDLRSFIPDGGTGHPRCGRIRQERGLSRNTAKMPHAEGPLWIGGRTVSDVSERPILAPIGP